MAASLNPRANMHAVRFGRWSCRRESPSSPWRIGIKVTGLLCPMYGPSSVQFFLCSACANNKNVHMNAQCLTFGHVGLHIPALEEEVKEEVKKLREENQKLKEENQKPQEENQQMRGALFKRSDESHWREHELGTDKGMGVTPAAAALPCAQRPHLCQASVPWLPKKVRDIVEHQAAIDADGSL